MLRALDSRPRSIPIRYLYDKRGAKLFERICELDEYYITRIELGILRDCAGEIGGQLGPRCQLIEFGSGAGEKIRIVLDERSDWAGYVPIDIAEVQLQDAAADLRQAYPGLCVQPLLADFNQELEVPTPPVTPETRIIFFPGSTIGNFSAADARKFLSRLARIVGARGGVLIGFDLHKRTPTLEAAYNDSEGVSAAFALNALEHLNRAHGADFNLDAFRYHSRYDAKERRIEMGLVSLLDQSVTLGGKRLDFEADELILTEYSYKFTLESFAELAAGAGLRVESSWTDKDQLFSVQLLRTT